MKPNQVTKQQVGVVANTDNPRGKYYLCPMINAWCLLYSIADVMATTTVIEMITGRMQGRATKKGAG